MRYSRFLAAVGFVTCVLFVPHYGVYANEIHYGRIIDTTASEVALSYQSPSGNFFARCSLNDFVCARTGTSTPVLTPAIHGRTLYLKNLQGTRAVVSLPFSTATYHILYDIRDGVAQVRGVLPTQDRLKDIRFAENGNTLVFISESGVAHRYDAVTKTLGNHISLGQTALPFLAISPNGNYLSTYSYIQKGHRLFDLRNGTHVTIPSEMPAHIVFSSDESKAAFVELRDGFPTLVIFPPASLPTLEKTRVSNPPSYVEDYLFVGEKLFFLANTASPLTWSLFMLDEYGTSMIEREVSYGDSLKNIGGMVAFVVVEGKNATVTLYDPETNITQRLSAAPASPASDAIGREALTIANRTAVLLTPKQKKRPDTLYVWLHGGPQRQTSVGYHPFFSYAVYDELLERIAEDAYVLKLDYTGSWGYGDSFMKALHRKIGVVDSADVVRAIDAFKKTHIIKNVVVMGNSYGGYLSLKVLADAPSNVSGAISINGVSNWYSLISRIPSSPFATIFEGTPSQHNLDAYFNAEVFTGLKHGVKHQPILVVYGEEDTTVPTWQSTEYIDFAKAEKKNVIALPLPGEAHAIRTRASLNILCTTIADTFSFSRIACR